MSGIRTYDVSVTGLIDCIQHRDNIQWGEQVKRWQQDPKNKKHSVAGDDRSPAWSWLGGLYTDGNIVTVPSDNLMRCLMEGAAMVLVPGGKNGKTFKSQSQSGMSVSEENWPLMVSGRTIPVAKLFKLTEESDFSVHEETAKEHGFSLYVKRAKIGQSKHVRVRPRLSAWSTRGTIQVWDDQITAQVLTDIIGMAGNYKGLFDWRPGGKTPGPFGRFTATIKEVK